MKKDYYRELLFSLLFTMIGYIIGITLGVEAMEKYFVLVVSWIAIIFILLEMFMKVGRK